MTIDAARARVDCSAALNVTTDGPLKVTLTDCPGGAQHADLQLRLTACRRAGGRRRPPPGAILGAMPSLLDRALNVGEAKKFKNYQKRVALIGAFEAELEHDSDAELRERMDALRERARDGRVAGRAAAGVLRDRARDRQAHAWGCATSTSR